MTFLKLLLKLDRLFMVYSLVKRRTKTFRLIQKLFKIIAMFPIIKELYNLSTNPTFLALRKALVWLSIALTILTVTTSMEPLTDINNLLITSLASLNLILYYYSERLYLFNFLMRRVENPAKIIEMLEENYVETELVFSDRAEMVEYLKNNPEKRLLLRGDSAGIKAHSSLLQNSYDSSKPWYDPDRYLGKPVEKKPEPEGFIGKYRNYLIAGLVVLALGGLGYYYSSDLSDYFKK